MVLTLISPTIGNARSSEIVFQLHEKKLSINAEKCSLKDVFSTIEKKSNYVFFYPSSLDVNRKVTVKVTGTSAGSVVWVSVESSLEQAPNNTLARINTEINLNLYIILLF